MVEEHPKPRIRPRRIIERPRLIRALDESDARIRLLLAGPGWGKTVLLEQWARDGDRTVGWFRARPSATDVAVVARGLVSAASPIVPGVGRRMLERLAVTEDPERESKLLAEMLAEDLGSWPNRAWLAIDNYEHVAASGSSDEFVQALIQQSSLNVLVIGRARWSWAESRALVPHDTHEVTRQSLAMTQPEVSDLLGEHCDAVPHSCPVRRLACARSASVDAPRRRNSQCKSVGAIHDFYAAELLNSLDAVLRHGLLTIALLPIVDRQLSQHLLGAADAHHLSTQSVELGIAEERDDRLEVQPLLLAYLQRRAGETPAAILGPTRALALPTATRLDSSF